MATFNGLNRIHAIAAASVVAVTTCLGCGGGERPKFNQIGDQLDAQVDADAAADRDAVAAEARAKADELAAAGTSAVGLDDMQRGSKVKGGGYLQTVVRGGIRGQQKLNMATVTHALNLFWGLEGRWPKDHDEFMEKVVNANGIALEPLQEPYEYWYNAEDHQLYKRVKQEAIDAAEAEAEAAEAEAAKD